MLSFLKVPDLQDHNHAHRRWEDQDRPSVYLCDDNTYIMLHTSVEQEALSAIVQFQILEGDLSPI